MLTHFWPPINSPSSLYRQHVRTSKQTISNGVKFNFVREVGVEFAARVPRGRHRAARWPGSAGQLVVEDDLHYNTYTKLNNIQSLSLHLVLDPSDLLHQ
jgi:hypothetical protein